MARPCHEVGKDQPSVKPRAVSQQCGTAEPDAHNHVHAQVGGPASATSHKFAGSRPVTSQRKIEANRRNAKRSTGPKTAEGKAASRRNAIKHGLASVVLREQIQDKTSLEAVATSVPSRPQQAEYICILAEATCELVRIRQIRTRLFESFEKTDLLSEGLLRSIARIDRYELRALSRRRKAMRRLLKDDQ